MNFIPTATGAAAGLVDGVIAQKEGNHNLLLPWGVGLAIAGLGLSVLNVGPQDISIAAMVGGLYRASAELTAKVVGDK